MNVVGLFARLSRPDAAYTSAGAKRALGLVLLLSIAATAHAGDNWKSVEADNGAVYKVNMASIQPVNKGGVLVFMYADEGLPIEQVRQQLVYFDCNGHMQPMGGSAIYLPPRSVGASVSALVCNGQDVSTATAGRRRGVITSDAPISIAGSYRLATGAAERTSGPGAPKPYRYAYLEVDAPLVLSGGNSTGAEIRTVELGGLSGTEMSSTYSGARVRVSCDRLIESNGYSPVAAICFGARVTPQ